MLVLLAIIKILCKPLFLSLKVYSIATLVSETKKISNMSMKGQSVNHICPKSKKMLTYV